MTEIKTTMENLSILAQLIVAVSILVVWVFRYDNIVMEFKQYGISDLVRNGVGASKIALATILALGVAYDVPVVAASLCMAILMIVRTWLKPALPISPSCRKVVS